MKTRVAALLLLSATLVACGGGDDPGGNANDNANHDNNNNANANQNGNANQNDNGNQNGNANQNQNTGEPAVVHRVGRFDDGDAAGPRFTWSGSAFRTRLSGTSLDVDLDGASGVFFEVVVDGVPEAVFETTGGAQRYSVVTGLQDGEHDVEIYRRNEGFFGTVQLVQLVPGAGASLLETPRPWQHRIEFIGDSITCGYGVEGPDANCPFSGATESAWLTYAAVASRELDAEAHLIAYSGKGVFQNYGGDQDELMPELYGRTLTNDPGSTWDFTAWIPEAVVVNLGTNDFSVAIDEADFVSAYAALLAQIRGHYPQAHIFCISWADWGGTHEPWVQAAMDQTGDPDLTRISFATDAADGYGCDWHPSETTHAKHGAQLAAAIRATLGW